jgi:hypothetical protein
MCVCVPALSCCCPQDALSQQLHWEQVVLQQAGHYQVVPLVLINLKGCPPGSQTAQLVEGIKVSGMGLALFGVY